MNEKIICYSVFVNVGCLLPPTYPRVGVTMRYDRFIYDICDLVYSIYFYFLLKFEKSLVIQIRFLREHLVLSLVQILRLP